MEQIMLSTIYCQLLELIRYVIQKHQICCNINCSLFNCTTMYDYIYKLLVDYSWAWLIGFLFNSYYTKWRHYFFPWIAPLILDPHFIMLSVKARRHQIPFFFWSLEWFDLGLNPSLSGHWQTLASLFII